MAQESSLKLSDKTIVISAPFTNLTCAIMTTLTGHGADCALITEKANEARHFCENLSDSREINENHGRAMAIEAQNADQVIEGMSRSAEAFGGLDVFIDGHFIFPSGRFQDFNMLEEGRQLIERSLFSSMATAQNALKFLEGRTKGRLIFLVPDQTQLPGESLSACLRSGLKSFVEILNQELSSKHVQAHCLSVGLTEEYLIKKFPKSPSVKLALEEFKKIDPSAKLQEPTDIANALAFLSSPLSQGFHF